MNPAAPGRERGWRGGGEGGPASGFLSQSGVELAVEEGPERDGFANWPRQESEGRGLFGLMGL